MVVSKLTELEESYLTEFHGLTKVVKVINIGSDVQLQKTFFTKEGRRVDYKKFLRTSSIVEQYYKHDINNMPLNKISAIKYLMENLNLAK